MAYTISNPQSGWLPLSGTDTGIVPANNYNTGSTTTVPTPPMYPGMIVTGRDPTYGGGEFILLKGVGSTAVGSVVTYNQTTFQTALAAVGTNLPQPIAIAMAATGATSWGWYQIAGLAIAAKTVGSASLASNAAVGVQTIGLLTVSSTGTEVEGALVAVLATASAATVQVVINRPHMIGRDV